MVRAEFQGDVIVVREGIWLRPPWGSLAVLAMVYGEDLVAECVGLLGFAFLEIVYLFVLFAVEEVDLNLKFGDVAGHGRLFEVALGEHVLQYYLPFASTQGESLLELPDSLFLLFELVLLGQSPTTESECCYLFLKCLALALKALLIRQQLRTLLM